MLPRLQATTGEYVFLLRNRFKPTVFTDFYLKFGHPAVGAPIFVGAEQQHITASPPPLPPLISTNVAPSSSAVAPSESAVFTPNADSSGAAKRSLLFGANQFLQDSIIVSKGHYVLWSADIPNVLNLYMLLTTQPDLRVAQIGTTVDVGLKASKYASYNPKNRILKCNSGKHTLANAESDDLIGFFFLSKHVF